MSAADLGSLGEWYASLHSKARQFETDFPKLTAYYHDLPYDRRKHKSIVRSGVFLQHPWVDKVWEFECSTKGWDDCSNWEKERKFNFGPVLKPEQG